MRPHRYLGNMILLFSLEEEECIQTVILFFSQRGGITPLSRKYDIVLFPKGRNALTLLSCKDGSTV